MTNLRSKKKKSNWRIFLVIIVFICWSLIYLSHTYNAKLVYNNSVIDIEKGDNLAKFYKDFWVVQKYMIKLWLRNNPNKVPLLQEGHYELNWEYTKDELLSLIAKGPQREYVHVTVLEWWSRYDIDAKLVEQWLIAPWEYIARTEDQWFIQTLRWNYPFLAIIPQWKSLEGFLYPDTYYLDDSQEIKDQLIKEQLKNFENKVRNQYSSSLEIGGVQITPYGIITLASIIENEEKNNDNKPVIAWIFINRLNKWMRLDADVSLCYGLKLTYNKCRENLNKNLNDASNLYNTRQNYWLTPTPISSPTVETINSLLNYKKTSAIFYLHDSDGIIHYSDTLQWHNENIRKFL